MTAIALRPWNAPTQGSSPPTVPSTSCRTVTPRKIAAWATWRRASAATSSPRRTTSTRTEPTVLCASKLVAPNAPAPARKNCVTTSAMARLARPRWAATRTGLSATGVAGGRVAPRSGAPPREAQQDEHGDERQRAGVAVGDGAGGREGEQGAEHDEERRRPSHRAARRAGRLAPGR